MSIELNKESVEQADASSCQGTNCGTTTGDHSSECLAEAAAGQGWELKPGDLCGRDCPIHKISVEQAGGDERAAFEACRDRRNALLESEGHKPGSKWHVTNAHYPTWEASRAALAQPYPKSGDYSDQSWINAGCPPEQPEQEEAERPEVVARVVHSNPVVLGQCGPLNANDELMTVAQHAASVARWAEMFNRVEQQRDAALASFKNFHRLLCERFGYTHDEKDWQRDQLSLIEHIAAAQAQHSVPEEFIGRLSEFLAQRGATGKALLRELRDMLAAAPVCRLSRSALTDAQMRRLYDSSTETENERLGFAAFARLIRRAEAVHQIAAAPGKEGV
ncbi:hypothetical protein ACEOUU_07010 [Pseudomonas aeruginosa]